MFVFVECEATHPAACCRLVPVTSCHLLFCLGLKKTSGELVADRWAMEEFTADDRQARTHTKKSQYPELQSATKQAIVVFPLPHAVWQQACLECLAWGLLITSAAASIGPSPWLQGCRWVDWAFRSYPLSPGASAPAARCSASTHLCDWLRPNIH